MTDALIAAHGEVDKLMPYLHLPVQSGSDRILKAMNRSHTRRQLSADHREGPRGAARHRVSGDFIVGFPGETEEDFEATLQIVDAVGYAVGLFVQIQRPPRHPGGNDGGSDRAARSWTSGCSGCRRGSPRTSSPSTAEGRQATRRS